MIHRILILMALVLTCVTPVAAEAEADGSPRGTLLFNGFEDFRPGPLTRAEAGEGVWSAAEGHAVIHTDHQRSGEQSLRILGGQEHAVELTLADDLLDGVQGAELQFWAERWTRRDPFMFRIHAMVGGQWQELYNGDRVIVIGGFNTQVRVPMPRGATKLRFVCTAPEGSGIMLDDLRLVEAVPMQIESVTTRQPVSPALIGNRTNPVALVEVTTTGILEPITLQQLRINTRGTTDLADVEAIEVYYGGTDPTLGSDYPDANFPEDRRFGSTLRPGHELTFHGEQQLQEGANYFWVSYQLKDSANIDHRLDAGCEWVLLEGGQQPIVPETVNPEVTQRMGVALRNAHDDDIRAYRIPGMVTTNEGTLIAVYDNRVRGWYDLPGDIDVGMSRSIDGGRTWEPMRVIMDMGSEDEPGMRGNGIGDPAVLVDRETNTIWVAATWSHGNRSWRGSGPGLTPDETGQLMLVKSEDDGVTWSEPINITEQVKVPEWCFLLQGPGMGITMSDGTIMFAAQYQDTPENRRLPRSTVMYSQDHGETWHLGTGAWDDTTEAQVVELEDGVLMLNCRYNRQNRRVVMTSEDMGQTWQEHTTTRSALTEPGACMASLINVDRELRRPYEGTLLFSNPASLRSRSEMTVRASTDGGVTWPEELSVLLDHGRGAGYSCLTMVDEDTVGILYEGNRAHMTFQRIPLAELLGEGQ